MSLLERFTRWALSRNEPGPYRGEAEPWRGTDNPDRKEYDA